MVWPESKVELKPWVASHYDTLITIFTFGKYYSMMKRAIEEMKIKNNDTILDMGAGTGRAACFMLEKGAKVTGMDISDEMITKFKKRCNGKAEIIKARIEEALPLDEKFDKVFISFVLHGFPQFAREKIIENAYNALKKGGKFFILDYNEFFV